jgi:hypothetical protein
MLFVATYASLSGDVQLELFTAYLHEWTHLQVKHPLRDRLRAAGSMVDNVETFKASRSDTGSMSESVGATMTISTIPSYPQGGSVVSEVGFQSIR